MKYIIFLTGCATLNINNFPHRSFVSSSTKRIHVGLHAKRLRRQVYGVSFTRFLILTAIYLYFISHTYLYYILPRRIHPSVFRINVCNVFVYIIVLTAANSIAVSASLTRVFFIKTLLFSISTEFIYCFVLCRCCVVCVIL